MENNDSSRNSKAMNSVETYEKKEENSAEVQPVSNQ
jgi:hypothetical protein